ncbi:MAG TPA: hypothetical protein VJ349_25990, partial [Stellaceae bacterium]|nr:hypothetical protein [Stellaceae bacterium]
LFLSLLLMAAGSSSLTRWPLHFRAKYAVSHPLKQATRHPADSNGMSLRAGLYSPVDYFFIDATGSPGRAASRPFGDDRFCNRNAAVKPLYLELRRPGWGGDQATAHHLEAPAPVFDILIDDRGGSVGAPDSSSARNSASAAQAECL